MTQVMKFTDATSKAAEQNRGRPEDEAVGPEIVEKLRHRLISNEYCDSAEVRLAVIGELVYQCYKQLQKKTYL